MELAEKLGSGAYATVWRADKQAIKVFPPGELYYYQQEMEILMKLNHPNVISMIRADFMIKDGHYCPYIAFPLMNGRLKRLPKDTPMPKKLSFVADILNGLTYLHRKKIIHGDIKPENILLDDDRAVIADLGCATSSPTTLTVGTRQFNAPEVLLRTRLDRSSDIWSAFVLFYELFTDKWFVDDSDDSTGETISSASEDHDRKDAGVKITAISHRDQILGLKPPANSPNPCADNKSKDNLTSNTSSSSYTGNMTWNEVHDTLRDIIEHIGLPTQQYTETERLHFDINGRLKNYPNLITLGISTGNKKIDKFLKIGLRWTNRTTAGTALVHLNTIREVPASS